MNRTVLVHLMTSSRDRSEAIESMAELEDLARAAGARIARKVFQTRASPDPRTFIGGGKVEEIEGILRETGADLVLFDPQVIGDKATFSDPHQFPVGIKHVIVNGELVLEDEQPTGLRPGKVLKRSACR